MMTIHDYRINGIGKYLNTIYKSSRNEDNEDFVNFQTSLPVFQKAIKTKKGINFQHKKETMNKYMINVLTKGKKLKKNV